MLVSQENKTVAKTLRNVFKGDPHYARYADENEKSTIDILSCSESPEVGLTSFGTLGLSDFSIGKEIEGVPLGVELVGVCRSEFDFFANVISTCAFNIINSKFRSEPGTIFSKIVEMYAVSPMKHILFTNPFAWDEKLETLYLQPYKVVAWLQIIPISDKENEYAKLIGVDVFDLFRSSVL